MKFDPFDPVRRDSNHEHEELRVRPGAGIMATGTLACPSCDIPTAPAPGGVSPADPIECPWCGTFGRVRDFLTLTGDPRPARVQVRVSLVRRH